MVNYRSRLVLFVSLARAASFLSVNPVSVQAQPLYGTIQGQVQDQQGAAIGKAVRLRCETWKRLPSVR